MASPPRRSIRSEETRCGAACSPVAGSLGKPAGRVTQRQVWLERELKRLTKEIHTLSDENMECADELIRIGAPVASPSRALTGEPISVDQVEVNAAGCCSRTGSQVSSAVGKESSGCSVRLAAGAESMEDDTDGLLLSRSESKAAVIHSMVSSMAMKVNAVVMNGSALRLTRGVQAMVYLLAFAGVVLVLVGMAVPLPDWLLRASVSYSEADSAAPLASSASGSSSGHSEAAHHRLLSGGGGHDAEVDSHEVIKSIAVSLTGCGLIALTVNLLQQPLILGYLLGGVLVGPNIGLGILDSGAHIEKLSSLGLIFLLFMIGLELDIKALLKMGKIVLVTGALQFPICAGVMIGIFMGLEKAGLSFGEGPYASMYCGMVCGISSTMIVVKLLGEKGETDTQPGRLTVGILIFQDIWAIVVLAIQPDLANPEIMGILRTFGMIAALVVLALLYAKFIMPAVLYHSSSNLELMFVMSLTWCFFICITAILPFVGLSMELASLIAGVALATFPYSAEFNGKIKYIRDFFITLFFAGLGMVIPVPTVSAVFMGVFVAVVVLAFRWLGIFSVVCLLGGGTRLGAISTINLSQVSEFALVICSLGISFGHVKEDTMVIIIWTFAILAISSSYLLGYNDTVYRKGSALLLKLRGRSVVASEEHAHGHGEERDIVLLGYHKVAFMLVAEVKAKSPQLLDRMHIIDFNQAIMSKLRDIGLQCTYGDISSPDVLEHAHHGEPRIVISTIPDSMLRGVTNAALVTLSKKVWPDAYIIATADSPEQASQLYACGADYVLRMAKLCAERLHKLLSENEEVFGGGELQEIFDKFKLQDKELRSNSGFIRGFKF